jgi:hypothetical protein
MRGANGGAAAWVAPSLDPPLPSQQVHLNPRGYVTVVSANGHKKPKADKVNCVLIFLTRFRWQHKTDCEQSV